MIEGYQRNDGVVNTRSMSGPVGVIYGQAAFLGPGNTTRNMVGAKGRYWHLGENVTMDHAD